MCLAPRRFVIVPMLWAGLVLAIALCGGLLRAQPPARAPVTTPLRTVQSSGSAPTTVPASPTVPSSPNAPMNGAAMPEAVSPRGPGTFTGPANVPPADPSYRPIPAAPPGMARSAPFLPPAFEEEEVYGPVSPYAGPTAGVAPRMRDLSWIYIENPPPKVVKVHDIITVIVSENSEVTSDSRFERQRNAQLRAQLRQFIRIDDKGNLNTAAKNSPTIDGQLRSQLQSSGLAKTREGIRYRIAATVVDVRPNGTVILEARKTIRTNEDLWEYSLTGRIRTEDVLANNTVLSENIADLQIDKLERGKVSDSTKRGWFLRLYDFFLPF